MPSIRELVSMRRLLSPVRKGIEEHRVFGIDHAEPRRGGRALAITHVAADGRRRAAGAGADDNPGWGRVAFEAHLREQAFGDVVVAAPIGRALGISELIHVVAAGSLRDPARLVVDLRGLREAHLAAEKFDRFDLRLGGRARSDGDEGQTEQASEIGLRDRGRAG